MEHRLAHKTFAARSGFGAGVSRWTGTLKRILGFGTKPKSIYTASRKPVTHVVIIDGTMSSLDPGYETHAGRLFKMLSKKARTEPIALHYEAGIQWQGFRRAQHVLAGVGLNQQIRRAYGFLASRYRPGDKIYLFGFSRGAFAVRSLAGVIDRVGLVKSDCATERYIRTAWRHYRKDPDSVSATEFAENFCLKDTPIEMIGAWDTVKALGVRLPFFWQLSRMEHEFHDHRLSNTVKSGFHALAFHETRKVYEPVLWNSREDYRGELEQVWFPGTHGDVGGHVLGVEEARLLANIPFKWMLEKALERGVPLDPAEVSAIETDARAPSVGQNRGWGKLFLMRGKRRYFDDPSEKFHHSLHDRPKLRARAPRFSTTSFPFLTSLARKS